MSTPSLQEARETTPHPQLFTVKTGPVRTSGYALKLRRAVNAAFRDYYKKGILDPKQVNDMVTSLNRVIYEVLVNQYRVPKEAVVNITLDLELRDGELVPRDVSVEVWERDEILSNNATQDVRRKLGLASQ